MSILVEQQDETVDAIHETAANVEKDTEMGTGHTNQAVSSARAARKKRWICFGLFILLLIIVAIIIAVVVLNNKKSERFFVTSCAVRKLTDYRRLNVKRSVGRAITLLRPYSCMPCTKLFGLHLLPQPRTTLRDGIFASAFLFDHLSPSLFISLWI